MGFVHPMLVRFAQKCGTQNNYLPLDFWRIVAMNHSVFLRIVIIMNHIMNHFEDSYYEDSYYDLWA
jgi:hypothetical protein